MNWDKKEKNMDFTKEDIKQMVNEFFVKQDKRDTLIKLSIKVTNEQLKKIHEALK